MERKFARREKIPPKSIAILSTLLAGAIFGIAAVGLRFEAPQLPTRWAMVDGIPAPWQYSCHELKVLVRAAAQRASLGEHRDAWVASQEEFINKLCV